MSMKQAEQAPAGKMINLDKERKDRRSETDQVIPNKITLAGDLSVGFSQLYSDWLVTLNRREFAASLAFALGQEEGDKFIARKTRITIEFLTETETAPEGSNPLL